MPSYTTRGQVTFREMSATGSRSVRNTVEVPGRRVTWATWPSTHTQPRRPIHWPSRFATVRTGVGFSGVLSNATARPPGSFVPLNTTGAVRAGVLPTVAG